MKHLVIFLGCQVIIVFSGCDRWTSIKSEIKNLSSDTIILIAHLDSLQTRILPPNGSITDFGAQYTEKRPKKNFKCCPCEFSYLELYPKNPGKKLVKDVMVKENWDLDKSRLKEDRIMDCAFIINSTDIQ